MTIPCRVLPHEQADGPANMALDEALLDAVAADPSSAVLRTYGWTEPTLSLGYFQPIALASENPRWRDAPTVRRASGGGALWHDREITYALVVPKGHPLARRSTDLYRAIHAAIAGVLREAGVAAARRGEPAPGEPAPGPAFLCFLDRDPEDLVVGPDKLVGSAQRRRIGAVLQHGAILLARSPGTPELPGASDLACVPGNPGPWLAPLRKALTGALGLEALDSEATPAERGAAATLERRVYRDRAWTARR